MNNQLQRVNEDTDNTTTERSSSIDQPEVAEWEKHYHAVCQAFEDFYTADRRITTLADRKKLCNKALDTLINSYKRLLSSHEEKVRADWLRSEIEKLEGMKKKVFFPNEDSIADHDAKIHNTVLSSIITRYKEELRALTGE